MHSPLQPGVLQRIRFETIARIVMRSNPVPTFFYFPNSKIFYDLILISRLPTVA